MSTSVSTPTPDRTTLARKSRRVKWIVTISAAVLLIGLVFVLISTQGYVTGEEFSPTHFQSREFSFYEIPLIHIQITPIRRSGSTSSTATYVRQNSLIRPHKGKPSNWHLVSISRGVVTTPADANLLLEQLKLKESDAGYWREWSADHPEQARVFWPMIQKLAERELYLVMPQLFELAQMNLPPEELQQQMDELLLEQYVGLIRDMSDAGRPELAEQLRSEAQDDYPGRKELQAPSPNSATP